MSRGACARPRPTPRRAAAVRPPLGRERDLQTQTPRGTACCALHVSNIPPFGRCAGDTDSEESRSAHEFDNIAQLTACHVYVTLSRCRHQPSGWLGQSFESISSSNTANPSASNLETSSAEGVFPSTPSSGVHTLSSSQSPLPVAGPSAGQRRGLGRPDWGVDRRQRPGAGRSAAVLRGPRGQKGVRRCFAGLAALWRSGAKQGFQLSPRLFNRDRSRLSTIVRTRLHGRLDGCRDSYAKHASAPVPCVTHARNEGGVQSPLSIASDAGREGLQTGTLAPARSSSVASAAGCAL